jgi:hypothetical protein
VVGRTTGVKSAGLQRRLNPVAPLTETDKYLAPFPRLVWLHHKRPSGKGKVTVKGNWDRTHQFCPSGSTGNERRSAYEASQS